MESRILGLHHITAIANNAQRNYNFYTKVLGMRLVKKTVNFDDPGTYHFYFGDEVGNPGTILTFFPISNAYQGERGTGQAVSVGLSIPQGSLEYWMERLHKVNVPFDGPVQRFNEEALFLYDRDDLAL